MLERWYLAVGLCAILSTTGCGDGAVPGGGTTCVSHSQPVSFCAAAMAGNMLTPGDSWACVRPAEPCADAEPFANGCVSVFELQAAGVELHDECVIAWRPNASDEDMQDQGSGTGDNGETGPSDGTESDDETDSEIPDTTATGEDSSNTWTSGDSSDGSMESSSTMDDSSSSTEDERCRSDDDCSDAEFPACDVERGECVTCLRDSHCAGHAQGPYCENQNCIGCRENSDCSAEAPICDRTPGQGQCRPCARLDGECDGDAACQVVSGLENSGQCLEKVVYVRAQLDECSDDNFSGTKNKPFCTIGRAVEALGGEGTIRVRSSPQLSGRVELSGGDSIAVLTDGGPTAWTGGGVDGRYLQLSSTSLLIARGLDFLEADEHAIVVENASTLRLEDARIVESSVHGIDVSGADARVWLHNVEVLRNQGYGVRFSGESLHLSNSMIAVNGASVEGLSGGIYLSGDSALDAVYTTIAYNIAAGVGEQIQCESGTALSVRNSILVGSEKDSLLGCNALQIRYSVHDVPAWKNSGTGNAFYGDAKSANKWFVDPGNADFRLRDPALNENVEFLRDVALRMDEDPKMDIDKSLRPESGSPDWPGAHRPERIETSGESATR